MIFDPGKVSVHDPVVIDGNVIEQVSSYKYLGIYIDNLLKWNVHVEHLCSKLAQRLHFLRRLRLFGVSSNIMLTFYNAVLGSLIRYGMAAWFGNLTIQSKNMIGKVVKTAMKVIGLPNNRPLQGIYEEKVVRQAQRILDDPTHILFNEYDLLPSGRRYRASRYRGNRYGHSFIPASIALMNKVRR